MELALPFSRHSRQQESRRSSQREGERESERSENDKETKEQGGLRPLWTR